MPSRSHSMVALCASATLLAACANDGSSLLTTGSLNLADNAKKPAAAKVNPACAVLRARINSLRSEGTPARVEKVAAGKSKTVVVKREALAKMTALDKAHAEFAAKCSLVPPAATTAKAVPTLAPATAPKAKADPVAKKASDAAKAKAGLVATKAAAKASTETTAAVAAAKAAQ